MTILLSIEILNESEEATHMSAKDKANNAAKDIKGKAQEAVGKATGDKGDRAKGKTKQAEASAGNAVENTKDAVKDAID